MFDPLKLWDFSAFDSKKHPPELWIVSECVWYTDKDQATYSFFGGHKKVPWDIDFSLKLNQRM